MSDLQDAINRDDAAFEDHPFPRLNDHQVIVDAARRIANPDYEAANKAVYEAGQPWRVIDVDLQISNARWGDLVRVAIHAALGIDPPEDTG